MSHWFLVARDVMWFLLAFAPLFLSAYYGWSTVAREADELPDLNALAVAVLIQVCGIVCLYTGIIR